MKPSPAATVLASACKALPLGPDSWTVEGVGDTDAVVLISCEKSPSAFTLDGAPMHRFAFRDGLLHLFFPNEPRPRVLKLTF